ncbi:MAG: hypothetical protein WEB03_08000 [Nitriliruptor sp.]
MKHRTRRLVAAISSFGLLAVGAVACEASIDEDGAEINVDELDE